MLGFFFRHYDPWVDRYVVYDDSSSDGSLEVLRAHPKVELRRFPRARTDSFVLSHTKLQEQTWKESRGQADWVVVTALDEHLTVKHRPMSTYLNECMEQGVTLIPAVGYQMVSDEYPSSDEWLCESRTIGAPYSNFNKLSIFNPDALTETGFAAGRHRAKPRGNLHFPSRDDLMNLHYKYLGFERTFGRHREANERLGNLDLANGWGHHYGWPEDRLRQDWEEVRARAVNAGDPAFDPTLVYDPPRWWHPEDIRDEPRSAMDRVRGIWR